MLCGIYADKGTPDWPASDLNDELFSLTYSQNNPFGDPGSMREKYRDMSYGTFDLQGGVFGWFRCLSPARSTTATTTASASTAPPARPAPSSATPCRPPTAPSTSVPTTTTVPTACPTRATTTATSTWSCSCTRTRAASAAAATSGRTPSTTRAGRRTGKPFVTDDLGANGQPLKVDDYVIMPAVACGGARRIETGVFAHEFGHALGLPDLYDRTAVDAQGLGLVSSGGMGLYCLMAAGSYGGDYDHPAYSVNMCAWSKEQLGWITPREVTCDEPATLYFQGDAPEALKLWRGGDYSGKEHFLVESRQQKKWDQYLLGNGFLITHVDDGVLTQNDEPCPGGNPCLSGHYQVGVVEADNQWEMQTAAAPLMGPWFGESEDFFSAAGNDSLTDLTGPSSRATTDRSPACGSRGSARAARR